MITAAHILQLLNYASEELNLMTECGRHMEVHVSASEIAHQALRIASITDRASYLRDAEIMNTAARYAGYAFNVDPGRLSSAETMDERRARNAAIVVSNQIGMCRAFHVSRRFGLSLSGVKHALGAKRDSRVEWIKRETLAEVHSGDGASVDTTISGGGR